MAYETKPNTGSLFPNDRKESPNHPDRKGKALIDGQWFWVSSWDKGKFDSLSFTLMTPEDIVKYASGSGGGTQKPQQQASRGGGYGSSY